MTRYGLRDDQWERIKDLLPGTTVAPRGGDVDPVIVARGWSEEEKRAYRLADNELPERAEWDLERLRNELRGLDFAGFDFDLIAFEPDRLEAILKGLGS